jgi:hypothetical protein
VSDVVLSGRGLCFTLITDHLVDTDRPSRGALPSVVCLSVIVKPR